MKVCFVTESIDPKNGSGRFAHSMVSRLQSDFGIEPVVLTTRTDSASFLNVKPILFPASYFATICLNPFIIAWYSRGTDLVHAFDGWPCMVATYLASLLSRLPFTDSLYGTYAVGPLHTFKQRYFMRAAYLKSSLNAAISHETKKRIVEGYEKTHIEVINQGISYEIYKEPRSSILPEGTSYILSVATIKRRKGYHIAIPAFAKVHAIHPDLKYVIVAKKDEENAYYRQVLSLIKQYALETSIIWLENVNEEDLIALYQHALVLFIPSISSENRSYFEGFGSVYLEAASCGLPSITSKGGGQEDAVLDGVTGFLIAEGDVEDAASKIKDLIQNEEKRRLFSENAVRFAKNMDWAVVLKPYVDRFKTLLKTSG